MNGPRSSRWGILVLAPFVGFSSLFVVASMLKFYVGSAPWIYDNTFGVWMGRFFITDALMNVFLPLAPLLALVLATSSWGNAHPPRRSDAIPAPVRIRWDRAGSMVVAVVLFALMSLAAYFVMEDGPCWWGWFWC